MHLPRNHVTQLFPTRRQAISTRVGLEHEVIATDLTSGEVPSLGRLRRAAATADLISPVSFEPGAQVEIDVRCSTSLTTVMAMLWRDMTALQAACATQGMDILPIAMDPRGSERVPLQLHRDRYLRMQQHFDRRGPAGRTMMRCTASTQVCLDWWPGRSGLEQWRVLLLAAPFLAAAFARSFGPRSRLATWLDVDPDRTGFDDRLLHGDDPVAAYQDFATHATVFVRGNDPERHLSTLFPPVRPRGRYIEVRFADAQELDAAESLVRTLSRLLYDQSTREESLRRLEPARKSLAEHWASAAAGYPETIAVGHDLVALTTSRSPSSAASF